MTLMRAGSIEESDLQRLKQILKVPKEENLVQLQHCVYYNNSSDDEKLEVRQQNVSGFLCLFESHLAFFQFLPETLKDTTLKEGQLTRKCDSNCNCGSSLVWYRNRHQQYAVLDAEKYAFYLNVKDKDLYTPIGVIPLKDVHAVLKLPNNQEPGYRVTTSASSFSFSCTSEEEVDEWIETTKAAMKRSEFSGQQTTVSISLSSIITTETIVSKNKAPALLVSTSDEAYYFSELADVEQLHLRLQEQKKSSVTAPTSPRSFFNLDTVGDEEPVTVPSHYASMNFKKFNLPDTEVLLAVFHCALLRKILIQGKLYVSNNYVCFYSKKLMEKRKVIIPLLDVTDIRKAKFQDHWVLNSIAISTIEKEFHFGSFIHRKSTYSLLNSCWRNSLSQQTAKLHLSPPMNRTLKKNLRITMLSIGTRGDIQPYIALGCALAKEGNHVKVCTHEAHRPFVEAWGLEFCRLAGNPKDLIGLCINNPNWATIKFAREASQFLTVFEDIISSMWEATKNGTDVMIHSAPLANIANSIAERLKIPQFVGFTMPWSRTTEIANPFCYPRMPMGPIYNYSSYVAMEQGMWVPLASKINAFRRNVLGLPALSLSTAGSLIHDKKVPFLYCWSPTVLPKPSDWEDHLAVTGYWHLEKQPYTPSNDLVEFIARGPTPPVYIGFGSVNVRNPDKLTRSIVKALRSNGLRAIIMITWGGETDLKKYADVLYPVQSIPHDWLFPQMSAVIHHGGAGTCGEGLRSGVPTMIVPFFGDQFLWGSRVEALGVGISPFPFNKLSTSKLTSALRKLTKDPSIKEKAALIGREIQSQDGIARAVEFFHLQFNKFYEDKHYSSVHSSLPAATTAHSH